MISEVKYSGTLKCGHFWDQVEVSSIGVSTF